MSVVGISSKLVSVVSSLYTSFGIGSLNHIRFWSGLVNTYMPFIQGKHSVDIVLIIDTRDVSILLAMSPILH